MPRDPLLRKEAEKKILREKISDVNRRLTDVNSISVTPQHIGDLVKKFEFTRPSPAFQELQGELQERFDAELGRLREAEQIALSLGDKENTE